MSNFVLVLIIVSLQFLLDYYLFQGLRTITARWSSPFIRRWVHVFYWSVNIVMMALIVAARISFDRVHSVQTLTIFTLNFFILMFIPKAFGFVVLAAEDLTRLLRGGFTWGRNQFFASDTPVSHPFLPERRRFVSQIGIGLAFLPFMSIVYGMTRGKYAFRVVRQTIWFPDLPEAFDGFRITQVSDIHSGSFGDQDAVRRGVELANAQKSDLLLFTGDLVNSMSAEVEPWLHIFSTFDAPLGKFSILGNHDYGDYHSWPDAAAKKADVDQLKSYHGAMGFRLLLNENVQIEKNGQSITLLGVENWGSQFIKYGDIDLALKGVAPDAFKILLSHDPSHWDMIVSRHAQQVHLTLSGHTHGAQMGVEIPGIKWSPIQYRYPHWAGLYGGEAGRYLYVNRGFGYLGFHGRVGIPPEITVIELKRGTAS
jgi:hypothetical protein